MSSELSTKGRGKTFNAIQNNVKTCNRGKEQQATCENIKRAISMYIFHYNQWGSPGAFFYFFLEKTRIFWSQTSKSTVRKKKKYPELRSTKRFQNSSGQIKISLCIRKFLFLPYLWQDKMTNPNHRIVMVRYRSTLWRCTQSHPGRKSRSNQKQGWGLVSALLTLSLDPPPRPYIIMWVTVRKGICVI